jgi:hypothetical protein
MALWTGSTVILPLYQTAKLKEFPRFEIAKHQILRLVWYQSRTSESSALEKAETSSSSKSDLQVNRMFKLVCSKAA